MSASFLALFFSTFVLEDVALTAALGLIAAGEISFQTGFGAIFLGISVGDFGLYGLGVLARRISSMTGGNWLSRQLQRFRSLGHGGTLQMLVVTSRFLPGSRLPVYVGAGFVGFSFAQFFFLTLASVAAWVFLVLSGSHLLKGLTWGQLVPAVLSLLWILHLGKGAIVKLLDPWERKAWLPSWRQWLHFEFWPAWFFYLPVVPMYIYHALRRGSFFLPFYAHPGLAHGGLIGESKWAFLKSLDPADPSTLPARFLPKGQPRAEALQAIESFGYPVILKPDVGQRGYGVRRIQNRQQAEDYLKHSQDDGLVLQKLSVLQKEAGLFYVRRPSQEHGQIFSVTLKILPSVTGDGKSKLGDLILADPRARLIASTYFARLKADLDRVYPEGQSIPLVSCGNHCQGAIFENGQNLVSPELVQAVERIARSLPDFYFGRLDVKYASDDDLKNGRFEIVEINGAGSEATHIWDRQTTLLEAYRTLFRQWSLLFAVGAEVKPLRPREARVRLAAFLHECLRVIFRKNTLSVSS